MKFIAFDLETTGTSPATDKIIEIGGVCFENKHPSASYTQLIDPGIPIPEEASNVNGISDEMVRGKPRINEILPAFADFCGDLPLVAHNAPFDFKFLLADIKHYQAPAPTGVVLDTLPLARRIFPGLPNYRLGTLVRHFDIPCGTFHRAEDDSACCGLLFALILDTLRQRGLPCDENELQNIIGKDEMRFPQFKQQPDQLDLFG